MNLDNVSAEYLETIIRAFEGKATAEEVVSQLEHEERIRTEGYARSHKQHDKAAAAGHYSSTKTGKWAVSPLVAAFSKKLDEMEHVAAYTTNAAGEEVRRRGKPSAFLALFRLPLSNEQIAFLTIKAVLDTMMGRMHKRDGGTTLVSKYTVQTAVIRHLLNESELTIAEAAAHQSFKVAMKQIKEGNLSGERAMRAVQKRMSHHGIEYDKVELTSDERNAIGLHLMQYLVEATGMVEETTDFVAVKTEGDIKKRSAIFYRLSQEFISRIGDTQELLSLKEARHEPMLVPPVPWSYDNLQHGPYLHPLTNKAPMIKRFTKAYLQEIQNTPASQVLIDTVNTIQDVPYMVNDYVLEAVEWCVEHDEVSAGLPAKEDLTYPKWDEEYRSDAVAKAEWKEEFARVQSFNAKRVSHTFALHCTIDSAKRHQGRPLWFPVQLDSRGRAYPMATFGLTYQGSSFQKALLQSYEARPINTQEQLEALYIQCATEGEFDGVDKASFVDRVKWVEENLEAIKAVGEDFRNLVGWWTEAAGGKPFMFLAACRAIYEFHQQGWGYECHLFAYEDATCSGIQVYSALLRDEEGGFNVNLVPGHDRQDIYQLAADRAAQIMRERTDLTAEEEAYRKTILAFGIPRAATKRQTMTKPYNSKERSCEEYTREWVVSQEKNGLVAPDLGLNENGSPVGTANKMAKFLSSAIWEAIEAVAPKPCEAMRWIEDVTGETIRASRTVPLQWALPDGMICVIDHQEQKNHTISTRIYGKTVNMQVMRNNGQQHSGKHKNACPPNFVHSLDALHLREAARMWEDKCAAQGRKAIFTFVHDSFGVPAADMPEFHKTIREAFVKIHTQYDLLGDLLDSMQEIAGPDVTFAERPALGKLDIEAVKDSEFFFS